MCFQLPSSKILYSFTHPPAVKQVLHISNVTLGKLPDFCVSISASTTWGNRTYVARRERIPPVREVS